jgi:hypothetical protein
MIVKVSRNSLLEDCNLSDSLLEDYNLSDSLSEDCNLSDSLSEDCNLSDSLSEDCNLSDSLSEDCNRSVDGWIIVAPLEAPLGSSLRLLKRPLVYLVPFACLNSASDFMRSCATCIRV